MARQGERVASAARKQLESTTGENVITDKNAKDIKKIVDWDSYPQQIRENVLMKTYGI